MQAMAVATPARPSQSIGSGSQRSMRMKRIDPDAKATLRRATIATICRKASRAELDTRLRGTGTDDSAKASSPAVKWPGASRSQESVIAAPPGPRDTVSSGGSAATLSAHESS